ncbi:hypothetical protein D3C77_427570 [compost metagenome]
MAQGEQAADAVLGGVQAYLVPHPHADTAQMALSQQAAHGGGMGDPDVEGLVAAKTAPALDGDPYHPAGQIPQQYHLAERGLGRGEQLVPGVLVDDHLLGQGLLALAIEAHALGQAITPDLE